MNRRTIQLTSMTLTSLVSMSSFVHPKQYQLALNILTLALTAADVYYGHYAHKQQLTKQYRTGTH